MLPRLIPRPEWHRTVVADATCLTPCALSFLQICLAPFERLLGLILELKQRIVLTNVICLAICRLCISRPLQRACEVCSYVVAECMLHCVLALMFPSRQGRLRLFHHSFVLAVERRYLGKYFDDDLTGEIDSIDTVLLRCYLVVKNCRKISRALWVALVERAVSTEVIHNLLSCCIDPSHP